MSSNSAMITSAANGNGTPAELPSFFAIGPPRTGTSWLHHVLNGNARLPYPAKETRFFDTHFERGLEWYGAHYRKAQGNGTIGEVAPTYFASRQARERIAHLIPGAKIVCTFRNPVDRVLSLYRLKRAYGMIPWEFEEALARDPELMQSSRYASHLKEWLNTFGVSQVLVMVHDEMESDPQAFLNRVTDFVGARRVKLRASQMTRVLTSEGMTRPRNYYWTRAAILLAEWSKAQRLDSFVAAAKRMGALRLFLGGGPAFEDLPSALRAKLRGVFRPEVEELENMLHRDFSAWK
jgi:Sulfotransferase domain